MAPSSAVQHMTMMAERSLLIETARLHTTVDGRLLQSTSPLTFLLTTVIRYATYR